MLLDVEGFWRYDNRESFMAGPAMGQGAADGTAEAAAATTGVGVPTVGVTGSENVDYDNTYNTGPLADDAFD